MIRQHLKPDQSGSTLPKPAFPIAVALLLAWATWGLAGIDMHDAYLPWFEHIRATGPVAAFAAPFSDYTPPYLYMLALATGIAPLVGSFAAVKLVSWAGHLLLALAVRRLLVVSGHARAASAAALIALAPSLIVSPAVLVQCDAWWGAALVMALAAAVEWRHGTMLLWCGVAVGIKLQAAFAAPLFLAIVLAQRVPYRLWLIAPAGFVATLLPAWAAGWPAGDLLTIYLRQVGYSEQLSLNAPNLWTVVGALPVTMPVAIGSVGTAAAVACSLLFVAVFARRLRDPDAVELLHAALLCGLIVPGLLPRMHERYFFLADVLALTLATLRPQAWPAAVLVQFGSAAAIAAYIVGIPALATVGAAAMIAATWIVARPYLLGTPSPARPAFA